MEVQPEAGPSIGRGERMNERQRMWVFYYLGQVRMALGRSVNDLSMPVYKKLCELLSNDHESHQLSSPPTIVSVRALWHKATGRGRAEYKRAATGPRRVTLSRAGDAHRRTRGL